MPLAYASFWRRAAAFLLDLVVLWTLFGVTMTFFPRAGVCPRFIATLPPALYFILLESSSWQASLGKRLVGIRLMEATGRRVTLARAAARTALQFAPWFALISGIPWLITVAVIPYVMALFGILLGRRHRAWYDLLAGTAAIRPPSP
jgi:uncharacterized RDD family membrane protein YckC